MHERTPVAVAYERGHAVLCDAEEGTQLESAYVLEQNIHQFSG